MSASSSRSFPSLIFHSFSVTVVIVCCLRCCQQTTWTENFKMKKTCCNEEDKMSGNMPKTLKVFSPWQTLDECLALPLDTPFFSLFWKWVLLLVLAMCVRPQCCYFCPCQSLQDGCSERGSFEELSRWNLGNGGLLFHITEWPLGTSVALRCNG